jgi:spore germination protein KB
MTRKPIITSAQLLFLAAGSSLMFPYTFIPALRTPPANQDAWFVAVLMFVYVLVLNAPLLFLMNKFRGLNINETIEIVLGKFFGKAAAVIFTGLCLFCYAACMLMGVIFLSIFVFPDTPTWALALYMIVPAIYASWKGAGTIGRLATFIVPFMILTIVFFFLLGTNKMDFSLLQPVLADSTFLELNQGAFLTAARYSEIIIFLVFSYFLKQKVSINKTYAASLVTYGTCVLLIMIPVLTVLGPDMAKHAWNPYFTYTRQLEAYDFIQRVQSISTLAWFTGMLLKLSIYSFMVSYILSGMVKAKSHKGFVIPLSVIAFIICLLPFMNKSSTVELLRSDQVFPWIILPIIFVLPLIIVIVYFFRRKKINLILKHKLAAGGASDKKYEGQS